jgi:murein DD-endopeptidase MepM/ murein hydrolase activator NlpD
MSRGRRFDDTDDRFDDRSASGETEWESGEWNAVDGTADALQALPESDVSSSPTGSSGHPARARRSDEHPPRTRTGAREAAEDDEDDVRSNVDASSYPPAFSALRALARRSDLYVAPVDRMDASEPLIIAGSGTSMGEPFLKRRARPLTMRLATVTLILAILVTGLFAVTPLGASGDSGLTSFQALAGAVVFSRTVSYHTYIAQWGDEIETIAEKFHVQVGGIYELNNLQVGQDLQVGMPLKIPDDPLYGQTYRPPVFVNTAGGTRFGTDFWNSLAGNPPPESPCAPNGNGNPMGYQLQPPNPGAAWVRGFTWYHNGDDIANPAGTPIHAAQAGQVIWAGWSVSGFGYSVVIDHCNHISTLYGHMEQLLVKAGEYVDVGQVVGLEGATGWATGPHLHFSVLVDNNFVDPLAYFGWSIAALTA